MVSIHADPDRQILTFKFAGQVSAADMQLKVEDLSRELERLNSGFVAFTDLSELDFMENAGTAQIATYMDLCTAKGVGRIVRLISDPARDVGFQLLSVFHHEKGVRTITCANLEDAHKALGS
jgi:anti-anti-sigma regulatory factor